MATNRKLLNKGIQQLAWALPLMFVGPTVIYNSFINKQNAWHYLVLIVGICVCFTTVYLTFKGLNTITRSLFND